MKSQSLFEEVEVGLGESPVQPNSWSVAQVGDYGIIVVLDGLQIKLAHKNLEKFFDLVIDEEEGIVQTVTGFWIKVHADSDKNSVTITLLSKSPHITNAYPTGVVLDETILKAMGIEVYEEDVDDNDNAQIQEGVKMAYKKSGKKLKRGFRVTSGIRKGRVVSNIRTAHKPRAKASTRAKLRLARRKKKAIRILKSKRTRRKSLSKRVARMNAARK